MAHRRLRAMWIARSLPRGFPCHQCDRHPHPAGGISRPLAGGRAAAALAFSAREHRCGVRQPGGKGSVVLGNHFDPRSPYSASKAASDHLARAWQHTYGLPVLVSNCSNNYEPYHYLEKLIPRTLVNILRGQPIPVFGDGQNVHDWLYVEDHCPALDRILRQGEPGST